MLSSKAPISSRRSIRAILPGDDSSKIQSADVLGPCLLVQLPLDASGDLKLGKQSLQPQWRDVPGVESLQLGDAQREPGTERPALPLMPGPDRPDAVSPLFHKKVYGVVPPPINTEAEPPFPPRTETLLPLQETVRAEGSVIVIELEF